MATTQTQVDAVKSAVSSVSTCSPTTTVTLKALLLPKDASPAAGLSSDGRVTKTPRSGKTAGSKKASSTEPKELSAKERAALATQIVNAALKALGDAAKPVPPTPSKRQLEGELVKTATRNAHRRSSSTPMTPLQPRSLNRVSTSPVTTKATRTAAVPNNSINCLSTVECARVAFSALRMLQSSDKIAMPNLQLEAGMSSFVGRLISLGLHEQAVKEIRILKSRLDGSQALDAKKKQATADNKSQSQVLAEMLDFHGVKSTDPVFPLVITTQIHTLRILSAMKKPTHIEAALPVLRESHRSSPLSHLLSLAAGSSSEVGKVARQLETLSHILLSLTPGVSSKDDSISTDSRLSISPATALELQILGLEARLHWWKLAGHRGDVDRDISSPLSKCLVAYSRRLSSDRSAYALSLRSFTRIYGLIQTHGLRPSAGSKSPLAAIYQLLTTMARESRMFEDALKWATRLRSLLDSTVESVAKYCSISAQLLSLQLKHSPTLHLESEDLLKQVLAGVQGPLRGDTSELDDLLGNAVSLRRATMAVVLSPAKGDKSTTQQLPKGAKESLETFVLQFPRFCLRWLGKSPDPKSSTKDYLRYEQRRQLLLQSIHHTLDSAFLLAKTQLDEQRLAWDELEPILKDCLALLENIGDIQTPDDATTYHVKISHFYYMKYNSLRQQATDPTDPGPLRALRRSIECVKDRSGKEKEKAQLLMKLERMVELCKITGRLDEALGALQNIRTTLVDEQVLHTIATELATRPPQVVWNLDHKAEMLSRTLASIAKVEKVWINWAADLPEMEQAAVLEHRLWFVLLNGGMKDKCLTLDDPTVDALLRIYNPTKFPIRRLRTLLRVLCSTVGHVDQLSDIRSIAADAVQVDEKSNLGDDCDLARYLTHMKAFYSSVTGLIDGFTDLVSLRRTISVWKSMAETHGTREGLEGRIDNVPELLTHLQSVTDFLRMKGQDELLVVVLELSADISRVVDGPKPEDFINSHTSLALQYVNIGQTVQAERIFGLAESFSKRHEGLSGDVAAGFHLALTEHLLAVGNFAKANDCLASAKAAFAPSTQKVSRHRKRAAFAYASYLYSLISLERGDSHHALVYGKDSARMMFQEWSRIEAQFDSTADAKPTITENTSLASSVMDRKGVTVAPAGPESWKIFKQLIQSISWLSTVYDHLGMFQETLYYAEEAERLARTTNSGLHLAQSTAWLASVYLKADNQEKSLEFATQARAFLQGTGQSCILVNLACQIGTVYRGLGDSEAEAEMLEKASSVLAALGNNGQAVATISGQPQDSTGMESAMAELEIKEKPARRTRAAAVTTRRKGTAAPSVTKPKTASRSKSKAAPTPEPARLVKDIFLDSGRASLLVQNAVSLFSRREWARATELLREAKDLARLPADISNGQLTMATCLLGQSLEEMTHDSVFSVVHDSTLSFPTIMGAVGDKAAADRLSLVKSTPPAKTRGAAATQRKDASRDTLSQPYVENLLEAQECLLEAHATAAVAGDSSLLHRISTMLQNVTLLLSTISAKSKPSIQVGHATSSTELARNLLWRRERKALVQEKACSKPDGTEWPELPATSADSRRSSLGFSLDLNKFQRDYIEIIPKPWTAVSIALGENKHDLCITKLQAGHSPFVIRLPLERASSRDADNEVFNFQQGRSELQEIIKLVNATCHDARDMTVKGAKAAWWAEREELDTRLKNLLELIERDWLGGFRGIFSQHQRRADLLARFQKSFQNVLDKHLPSRRQVRGRKTKAAASSPKVTLDPRILELFIGLGDATADDCDFDDELTDLLYFVVDILQFHGERNAYDEVDFDAMVVETFDALRAYHSMVKGDRDAADGTHTILVLDKALHAFPWESLPCMQGLAVSRVPSLACLRRLILEQRAPASAASRGEDTPSPVNVPQGHHVSPNSGTYILNPSSDLKTTLGTFDQPLSSQLRSPSWSRIVSRAPTEAEFERALSESDVLLYFGHGSGAQYIRGRTVRRLDRCRAAALLMGCSSAGLADAGGYEAQGPVWNYLMAGCPAVVGTLWDVTDRDIDRLAGRALEEWGLLARGTFVEDKKKYGAMGAGKKNEASASKGGDRDGKPSSLVEAVSCAREDACRFRYITAAAVAVYGIPVYIDR